MMKLIDMVKNDKQVFFKFYRAKELWYATEDGFEFPVPIDDTGDGVFLAKDRAMLFMRYIRKHLQTIDEAKNEIDWGPDIGHEVIE
jgi:hypothetical protein